MRIREFIIIPSSIDAMGLIHKPGTGPNNRFGFKNVGNNKANELEETKEAPPGTYFTKAGNLVKGRLTKAAKAKGARETDPKDKQRSKVPPVTQRNEARGTCWHGYQQKGYKKKGNKMVPNCVKEEELDEIYKGKHGQSEKEYQDGRSDGGKMVSGDSKGSGAAYSSRAVKNTGPNPAGGSKKPQGQGRMTSGARADLQYRKANLKKSNEEFINKLSASGLFTEAELQKMGEME